MGSVYVSTDVLQMVCRVMGTGMSNLFICGSNVGCMHSKTHDLLEMLCAVSVKSEETDPLGAVLKKLFVSVTISFTGLSVFKASSDTK